jgi:hypothetical protein
LKIEQLATAIDCEGSIGINRIFSSKTSSKPQFSARIMLGMIHPAIPQALRDTFGSTITVRKSALSKSGKSLRPIIIWSVVGNRATRPILEALLPHLVIKQEQAKNALAMIDYIDSFPRVRKGTRGWTKLTDEHVLESYWLKAKELNHVTPATTKREGPVMGCDSLTSCESMRGDFEVSPPPTIQ